MSLELVLTCDECGKDDRPTTGLRWAPYGCLEIRGGTSFYVDGGSVLCPEHADLENATTQRTAWTREAAQRAYLEQETR